jgi:hypothetical protein
MTLYGVVVGLHFLCSPCYQARPSSYQHRVEAIQVVEIHRCGLDQQARHEFPNNSKHFGTDSKAIARQYRRQHRPGIRIDRMDDIGLLETLGPQGGNNRLVTAPNDFFPAAR